MQACVFVHNSLGINGKYRYYCEVFLRFFLIKESLREISPNLCLFTFSFRHFILLDKEEIKRFFSIKKGSLFIKNKRFQSRIYFELVNKNESDYQVLCCIFLQIHCIIYFTQKRSIFDSQNIA